MRNELIRSIHLNLVIDRYKLSVNHDGQVMAYPGDRISSGCMICIAGGVIICDPRLWILINVEPLDSICLGLLGCGRLSCMGQLFNDSLLDG